MSKIVAIALGSLIAFGGLQDAEAIMTETLVHLNGVTTAMESAKKVRDVKPRMDAVAVKLAELKKRAAAMKLTDEQTKFLETKMQPQMQKAAGRFLGAAKKLSETDPAGGPELAEAMTKLSNSLK